MTPEGLLKKINAILEELNIPHGVTGGFAIVIWGKPRYTADIDVIIELADSNIKPLAQKLLAIDKDVYADEDMMKEALQYHGEFNFVHPQTGLKVDFFVQEKNPYNKLKMQRVVFRDIEGQKIPFISPEDLIISKLMWSRGNNSQKQFEDIKSIIRNPNIRLDMEYLNSWAERQEVLDVLTTLFAQAKLEN